MARPRSDDFDKKRADILDAAARLYAHHGFAGTSIADLAAACGASKSLIYHYFGAKEDILHAIMAAHLELLLEAAEQAAALDLPATERLRALTIAFMRLYAGAEASHKILLNELDSLPEEARADVVAKQRRIIALAERIIAEIRPGSDTRIDTMLFFGMINWTHTWFDPAGAVMPEALAARAVEVMLKGLTPQAS